MERTYYALQVQVQWRQGGHTVVQVGWPIGEVGHRSGGLVCAVLLNEYLPPRIYHTVQWLLEAAYVGEIRWILQVHRTEMHY